MVVRPAVSQSLCGGADQRWSFSKEAEKKKTTSGWPRLSGQIRPGGGQLHGRGGHRWWVCSQMSAGRGRGNRRRSCHRESRNPRRVQTSSSEPLKPGPRGRTLGTPTSRRWPIDSCAKAKPTGGWSNMTQPGNAHLVDMPGRHGRPSLWRLVLGTRAPSIQLPPHYISAAHDCLCRVIVAELGYRVANDFGDVTHPGNAEMLASSMMDQLYRRPPSQCCSVLGARWTSGKIANARPQAPWMCSLACK
jgi:hypothetical protein